MAKAKRMSRSLGADVKDAARASLRAAQRSKLGKRVSKAVNKVVNKDRKLVTREGRRLVGQAKASWGRVKKSL